MLFATEGSQVTAGQMAVLRVRQGSRVLLAPEGMTLNSLCVSPVLPTCGEKHSRSWSRFGDKPLHRSGASMLANFTLNFAPTLGSSGNVFVFNTQPRSLKCQAIVKMPSPASQCLANKANSTPCELSKTGAYFKIERSCPMALVSLWRLRNSREAFLIVSQ